MKNNDHSIIRSEQGFTLIELMITTSIIGILAGLAITTFWVYKEDAEYAVADATLRTARTAFEVGEQEAPDGYNMALTFTDRAGGLVPASMSAILPGAAVPPDVILGASFASCDSSSPALQVNQFLVAKPCKAHRYVQWIRFCGGVEILQEDVAGTC